MMEAVDKAAAAASIGYLKVAQKMVIGWQHVQRLVKITDSVVRQVCHPFEELNG
jgi:hypothetical protein